MCAVGVPQRHCQCMGYLPPRLPWDDMETSQALETQSSRRIARECFPPLLLQRDTMGMCQTGSVHSMQQQQQQLTPSASVGGTGALGMRPPHRVAPAQAGVRVELGR